MIEFLVLLVALFATGPWLDGAIDGARYGSINDCYLLSRDVDMRQTRPCKADETLGRQDTPSTRREDWR